MTRLRLTRAVLAVTAALALALSGALLAVAPASAAPGDAVLFTSPPSGATDVPRAVAIEGTGSDGATVRLTDVNNAPLGSTATVRQGGVWSILVIFPDDAPAQQMVYVTQNDGAITTILKTTFTLADPAPVTPEPLVVTSPQPNTQTESRFVEFTGTAAPGAVITAGVDGALVSQGVADANGAFTFGAFFRLTENAEDVVVTLTTANPDGTASDPVELPITLPAAIAAPVITSPVAGGSVVAGAVTIRGTGIAGVEVFVGVVPDETTLAANPDLDAATLFQSTVVAPDGTFQLTFQLPLGSYAVDAVHIDGFVQGDGTIPVLLSFASEPIEFQAVAAAAPAGTELANTGPTSTGLVGPGAALVVIGLLLVTAARRRVAPVAA